MSESLLANNAVSEVPDAARHRSLISRHRRIFKEVGAVTGITFVDHPKGKEAGVVVSALTPDGACAKAGVCVGDHITKINGTRPGPEARGCAVRRCLDGRGGRHRQEQGPPQVLAAFSYPELCHLQAGALGGRGRRR